MTNKVLIFGIFISSMLTQVYSQSSISDGEKYLKENNINGAKKVFKEHPENLVAIEYLGDIASFEKNWDQAIEFYEKLVDNQPNSSAYNFKLGGAMGMKAMESSKFKAALMIGKIKSYLNKAAELDKSHAEVRRALVELYMQLPTFVGGSKDVAQQYVEELHSINKVDAYLAEAYIYRTMEDEKAVKNAINKAFDAAKNDENLIERNYLNYELGERAASLEINPEMAVYFLKEYIKNYNYKDLKSPAWAYYYIAEIQFSQKNQGMALTHINKALANKFIFPEAEKLKQQILEM